MGNDGKLNGKGVNCLTLKASHRTTQKWRKSHTSFRGGGGTFSAVSHESKIGRTTAGRKRPEIANYKVSQDRSTPINNSIDSAGTSRESQETSLLQCEFTGEKKSDRFLICQTVKST